MCFQRKSKSSETENSPQNNRRRQLKRSFVCFLFKALWELFMSGTCKSGPDWRTMTLKSFRQTHFQPANQSVGSSLLRIQKLLTFSEILFFCCCLQSQRMDISFISVRLGQLSTKTGSRGGTVSLAPSQDKHTENLQQMIPKYRRDSRA